MFQDGDTGTPKNNEERESSKRSVPPTQEKISPVKKASRSDLPDSDSVALGSAMDSNTGTAQETPIPKAGEQVAESEAPQPASLPAPVHNTDPVDALLQKALDRISQLESKLAEQVTASQKGCVVTTAPSPSPIVTPAPKHKHLSPSTSSVLGSDPTPPVGKTAADPGSDDVEDDDADDADDADVIRFPNGAGSMSHDALRMRLRRLCEQKPKTKKCHVDEKTREQYTRGGEDREWLEIALVEAIQKVGPDRSQHKKLKVTGSIHG